MKLRALAVLVLTFVLPTSAMAGGENLEQVDRSFIGLIDFEARYGGYEEWVGAAWGTDDPELEFELADGRPFEAEATRLNAGQFTTLETGYEYPSILVYRRIDEQRLNDWVQVLIDGEPKWLRMQDGDRYRSYPSLFNRNRLAYLTSTSIAVSDHPGGPSAPQTAKPQDQGLPENEDWTPEITVLGRAEIITFNDQTGKHAAEHWFKIRMTDQPSCAGPGERIKTLAEGWIPARHDDGEVAVWFYSRGC